MERWGQRGLMLHPQLEGTPPVNIHERKDQRFWLNLKVFMAIRHLEKENIAGGGGGRRRYMERHPGVRNSTRKSILQGGTKGNSHGIHLVHHRRAQHLWRKAVEYDTRKGYGQKDGNSESLAKDTEPWSLWHTSHWVIQRTLSLARWGLWHNEQSHPTCFLENQPVGEGI